MQGLQIWLKSGNGPIDVFLCPDNKENVDPSSDMERDHDSLSASSQQSPIKSEVDDNDFLPQSDCSTFPSGFDIDLTQFAQQCASHVSPIRQRQRTLSSMNSPESSFVDDCGIKVEDELLSYEHIEETDQSVASLNVNFDSTDYLFSLEQNEGINDLFSEI